MAETTNFEDASSPAVKPGFSNTSPGDPAAQGVDAEAKTVDSPAPKKASSKTSAETK